MEYIWKLSGPSFELVTGASGILSLGTRARGILLVVDPESRQDKRVVPPSENLRKGETVRYRNGLFQPLRKNSDDAHDTGQEIQATRLQASVSTQLWLSRPTCQRSSARFQTRTSRCSWSNRRLAWVKDVCRREKGAGRGESPSREGTCKDRPWTFQVIPEVGAPAFYTFYGTGFETFSREALMTGLMVRWRMGRESVCTLQSRVPRPGTSSTVVHASRLWRRFPKSSPSRTVVNGSVREPRRCIHISHLAGMKKEKFE